MQKVSRISLCVVIGLLFLALIWKFAGAQLAKKGIVLSNDTAAKTVSETAPEAEDGSGNAGIKKLAETTPPNETPGWQYSSSGWWYATDATTYYVNGWADIDGNQYHFDSNGYMATGWKAIGGKGCYFDDQGVYQPDRNGSMMVALTFDDGPSENTGKILDILKQYNIKGTFFVTGNHREHDDLIKRAFDEGNSIGLHTYTHDYATVYASEQAYFDDLQKVSDLVEKITGEKSTLIRFPGGSSNTVSADYVQGLMTTLTKAVHEKGYEYFDWNCDSTDASGNNVAVSKLVQNATLCSADHVTILMHDTDAKDTTVEALPQIIEYYRGQGYSFKGLTKDSVAAHHRVNN